MRTALAVALALGLAACGVSGMHSGGMNSGGVGSTVTAAALDQAAQGAATTVAAYEAGAAALVTVPDCTAATQQYADRMKPLVAQMDDMGGQMDATLGSMGWSVHGDVQCSVGSMSMELARHMAAACGLPDMAANRSEIAQHVSTMKESANHMRMRAAEVMAMAGSGMMGGTGGGMGGNMRVGLDDARRRHDELGPPHARVHRRLTGWWRFGPASGRRVRRPPSGDDHAQRQRPRSLHRGEDRHERHRRNDGLGAHLRRRIRRPGDPGEAWRHPSPALHELPSSERGDEPPRKRHATSPTCTCTDCTSRPAHIRTALPGE